MVDNFDLNNPNNLNPMVNPNYPQNYPYKLLPQSNAPIPQSNVDRWNDEVKNRGIKNIKAINTDKSIDIDRKKLGFLKTMSFFGVLALLIIAVAAGYWGYTIYKDGTLLNPVSLVCGNMSVNVPDCLLTAPPQTCINNCNLTVSNITCLGSNFTCPACNPTLNCNTP